MTMRTLLILLDKEFRQFCRNAFLPKLALGFPLMVMLLTPWVTTMDVRQVGVVTVDGDRSSASRRLAAKIGASDSFQFAGTVDTYAAALGMLEKGDADVIVEVPDGFGESLLAGQPESVRITANGVNALKGSLGAQYAVQVVVQTVAELAGEHGRRAGAELVVVENRYNPTLDYRHYMIPALMIMLLILLCGFLPALNLVSEKETGTIEQINVTPVNRYVFTLAKLIPYWIVGLVALTLAMLLAWAVYGLVPAGSPATILLAAVLFVLTMSGIGVVVANYSATMQQAMFVMFFIVMLFVLMSGLITPVASMPAWAQGITRLLPPRYFIGIMQAVYLKGTACPELGADMLALGLFAVVADLLAALTYRKRE